MKRLTPITGESLSTEMKKFAALNGRIPSLFEIQAMFPNQAGQSPSPSTFYNLFAQLSEPGKRAGIREFARANGLMAAVIVDDMVYVEGGKAIDNPTIQEVQPPAPAEPAANTPDKLSPHYLGSMATADLIGLLGEVANVLGERRGQMATLDTLTQQILGNTAEIQ